MIKTFPQEIEDKLKAYRDKRRAETGKVLQRETAIRELLLMALADVKPATPLADRIKNLEQRLQVVETRLAEPPAGTFPV
jgi:hypothetical protein